MEQIRSENKMNELLKQLARESGLLHYNPDKQPNKLEDFAKMIVKECADIALREDHDPHECILRHFGMSSADIALDAMAENARQIGLDYD